MGKYKLSNLSFSFIFICIFHSSLLGIIIPYMIHEANTSVFMALVYGYILGLGLLFIYFKIFDFMPDKNIFEKTQYVMPRVVSRILFVLFGIIIFGVALITFFRLTTFISSQFLVNTPNVFITIILIIPIAYALMFDFDVMGRMATVCVFIGFFTVITNCAFLTGSMSFDNLKPILNNDFAHMASSSITFAVMFVTPIFSTLAIPKNNIIDNEKTKKYIFIAYTVSFISVFMIILAIVSVLGVSVANLYTYPSYVTLKILNVLNFLKNIENINAVIWLLYMTFSTGFYLIVIKNILHQSFNISKKQGNKISLFFVVFPFLVCAFLMLPYESHLNKYHAIYILAAVYFVIVIISFVVYLFGKLKSKIKE